MTGESERVQRTWFQRTGYAVIRVVARLAGVLLFGIRVVGREHFPREGGGVVCANHQSFLDPVLVGLCCDRRMNYLARDSLFRYPGFGWLIHFLDAVPIDRDGMGIGGLKETLRRLKRGELILIFPEGTRTSDGEIAPLKPGFLALVRRGKVPMIPVGIDGAYRAWPRNRSFPRPARIHIAIGAPIPPDLAAGLSDEELIEELSRRLGQCLARCRQTSSDPQRPAGLSSNSKRTSGRVAGAFASSSRALTFRPSGNE